MNDYHVRQYEIEYESTRRFILFLMSNLDKIGLKSPKSILDIGCGAGANTARLAKNFVDSAVRGIDTSVELIDLANRMNSGKLPNLDFEIGNLFDYSEPYFEGVTAIQTISWVPAKDMYLPFLSVLEKSPKWFAFSSLGFEGKAQARIEIEDFSEARSWSTPYNILSHVVLRDIARTLGYEEVEIIQYTPTKSILSSAEGMGSRTRLLDSDQLAIFSGPLYLPWYFYFFRKAIN